MYAEANAGEGSAMDLRAQAANYYWYHTIDLGLGVATDGDYDMNPLLPKYGFPESMRGMCVLDVGRGSGFFSFEFERRGADVTATDIGSYLDWDFVGGDIRKEQRRSEIGDAAAYSVRHITGAFEFARKARRSVVKGVFANVYELSPALFGNQQFDLVFAGSITSHLRDPVRALERMHGVTRAGGMCVVAAPCFDSKEMRDKPLMLLVGTTDSDRRSWWMMNAKGLIELMRCANFKDVQLVSEFDLVNRRVQGLRVPHIVVRGYA
jgi:tRNA (mo5U34)-methyltransferase